MNRLPFASFSLAAALLVAACSGKASPITPTPPIAPPIALPPATPLVSVKALSIEGNTRLTAIGETSQLTATLTFSDDSTRNVSSLATWGSNRAVATVSPTGLLTAVGFGSSFVSATYQRLEFNEVTAVVTPSGTFAVRGGVREPGQGYLGNVGVLDTRSGRSTTTGQFGSFTMGELPFPPHLRVERDDYEPFEIDAPLDGSVVDLPMQRIVRVTAGETAQPPRLAPNDLDYRMSSGASCFPCRLIRIDVPSRGTLHLHLTWLGSIPLGLWVGGNRFLGSDDKIPALDVDAPVGAGQFVVFAQIINPLSGVHVAFSLATALTP